MYSSLELRSKDTHSVYLYVLEAVFPHIIDERILFIYAYETIGPVSKSLDCFVTVWVSN